MAVDSKKIDPGYLRQTVEFSGTEAPGRDARIATRYGVGIGREGFGWSRGSYQYEARLARLGVPPQEMIERDPDIKAKLEKTPRGLGVLGGALEPYTVGTNVSQAASE